MKALRVLLVLGQEQEGQLEQESAAHLSHVYCRGFLALLQSGKTSYIRNTVQFNFIDICLQFWD